MLAAWPVERRTPPWPPHHRRPRRVPRRRLCAGAPPATAPTGSLARIPRQVGRIASALSLQYGEQAGRGGRHAEDTGARASPHPVRAIAPITGRAWRCAGGRARRRAAPDGRPGGTGRALRSDARMAGLWRRLSDDLCRRVLCNNVQYETVLSKPLVIILKKLAYFVQERGTC
jgi:hypothetical protein